MLRVSTSITYTPVLYFSHETVLHLACSTPRTPPRPTV